MKKADNFDASKWLVENKITFQSRLNEDEEKRGFYVTMKPKDGSYGKSTLTNLPNHANQTYHGALSSIERLKDINGKKGKKYAYYVSDKDGNPLDKDGNIINEESRLNENKTLGPDDFSTFKWKPQPANPKAKLEDLENEDTLSKGDFWKSDIIGNDSSTPSYGSENNGVWTFTWESGEISGFIEGEDFTLSNLNENEDLTAKIAALPDFNSAMDHEKSELIVGKYVVVRYDDSEYKDGQDMYAVWDNTVNQDEIGSYDDVPEFESEDPAEVAAFLKKNESLNEGRFDGWDFDSLVNYLIELADELDKNPQLEKKLDKILYRTIDIENIYDYDEEDIQQAIKQLERLKNSVQK